ncbi:MAG: XdhC family protein [Chloroflexi bacterium]|nr:MAG: XdhC family protein [Chloroflexota bacterium]
MKEILTDVDNWLAENKSIALATVIQTWGSAPRKVGAKMAFTPERQISGSVSGGCIEGSVFEAGMEVLESGQPRLLHFGVADETAWDVGLACGGTIEVFVERLDTAVYQFIHQLIAQDKAGATVTVIRGPASLLGRKAAFSQEGEQVGSLDAELDKRTRLMALAATHSQRLFLNDEIELFIDVIRPAPKLIMVGGVHIAVALTNMAKTAGFQTIVVDPRRAFGNVERFPHVDKLIQAWPDKAFANINLTPETAVVMLTHDPKIDDPALKIVLNSPVFYIGALGSQKTHAKRRQRLANMGFSEAEIGRIHAPVGLNIGAQTPEEIAVAILAEIIQTRHTQPMQQQSRQAG